MGLSNNTDLLIISYHSPFFFKPDETPLYHIFPIYQGQPEVMRDEDLEEKAYKRSLRARKKTTENTIKKLIKSQESR